MTRTRLELEDGKTHKFWEITLNGTSHTVRYGKIGSKGQEATKDLPDEDAAKASCDKLIAEKLRKGYVQVAAAPVAAPPEDPLARAAPVQSALAAPSAPVAAQTAAPSADIEEQLLDQDPSAALAALASGPLPPALQPAVAVLMMFAEQKKARAAAKAILTTHAEPAVVARFGDDRRSYHAISDGKKLAKILRELGNDPGFDPAETSLAVLRVLMQRNELVTTRMAIFAALQSGADGRRVFDVVGDVPEVWIDQIKGSFPAGLDALRTTEKLRFFQSKITKYSGELAGAGSIVHLTLQSCQLPNLGFSKDLPQLRELHLDPCAVPDIAPLAALRNVEALTLFIVDSLVPGYGDVRDTTLPLDLSPIAELPRLRTLRIHGPRAVDLAPLARLTQLEMLLLTEVKQVSDLAPLAGLTQLRRLTLERAPASDLTPLAGLTNLTTLGLCWTGASDLAPLAGMTALEDLKLYGPPIADLSVCARFERLKRLELWQTSVRDLSALGGLPELTAFSALYSPLGDLSVLAGAPKLASVRLVNSSSDGIDALKAARPDVKISL